MLPQNLGGSLGDIANSSPFLCISLHFGSQFLPLADFVGFSAKENHRRAEALRWFGMQKEIYLVP